MSPQVVVIGLDGMVPEIVFGPQGQRLECLRELMNSGRWARLSSTHPPISVPAWVSAFTGADPGELGIYGFRNRPAGTYHMRLATSRWVKLPWVWELAGERGVTSVVMGVPLTYPPRPIQGVIVAGIPLPPGAGDIARPRALNPRLARAGYMADMEGFRAMAPHQLTAQAARMATVRMELFAGLLRQWRPELGVVVEMSPDRVHHCLWASHDPSHPLHTPPPDGQDPVLQHYHLLDRLVQQVVEDLKPGTWIIVMSDHGAQALTGALAINEWLAMKGYLVLRARPSSARALEPEMVDWSRTRAWAEGGYYARIFFNMAGREPQGILTEPEAGQLLGAIKDELEAMAGEDGKALGNLVLLPARLYSRLGGQPPELMLYPAGLKMRAVSTIYPRPPETLLLPPGTSGLDQANHSMDATLIIARVGETLAGAGREMNGCTITQLAPTILSLLGMTPPPWMAPPWPL